MTALSGARDVAGLKKGAGFRILTGTVDLAHAGGADSGISDGVSGGEMAPV